MRKKRRNIQSSREALQQFIEAQPDKSAASAMDLLRRQLAEAIQVTESYIAAQAEGTQGALQATRTFHERREALLRQHMAPISHAARSVLATKDLGALRTPSTKASVGRLTAAARAMAKAAAPIADQLIAAGLPPDFLAQLAAAADAMVQPLAERAELEVLHKRGTKGIETSIEAAQDIVGMIDAFMRSAFADDPVLLAEWADAKRVRKG